MDTLLYFLFEKSTDIFCVLDETGFIKHTNAAFRKTLGYSESELAGKKITELSHVADVRRHEDLVRILQKKKEIKDYESRIKGIDGRYYNVRWSLLYKEHEGLVYASGVNLTSKLNGNSHHNFADNVQHLLQSFNEGFVTINDKWEITISNPAFLAISGLNNKQLKSSNLKKVISLGLTEEVLAGIDNSFHTGYPANIQYFNDYGKRWLRLNIYPYRDEVMIFIRDINSAKNQQMTLALEKKVLELNASPTFSLKETVVELLRGIEEIYPEMFCSVLEVDDAQERVFHLAAPRLPAAYCDSINGTSIGPKAGSCGTSAYHRSQVIVSDIETDPLWDDYRQLTQPFGYKACWSTPVISSHGTKVLATFAAYYKTARQPKNDELQLIERTTNILRVLIENKLNLDSIKEQNKMLQEIASISSHEIRRPVATIMGLVNLFDDQNLENPLNREIISHIDLTAKELDIVIHTIVEKTIHLKED
jgi:PAS domain S-box-containing protein